MFAKETLESRIAKTIANAATASSESVANLCEEAADALEIAEQDEKQAEKKALDPALGPEAAEQALRDLGKAQFRVKRLGAAVEHLGQLETERISAEAEAVRLAAYSEAMALRDQAAALIRAKYPGIQRDLMQIIKQVAAADGAVFKVNHDLPKEGGELRYAEELAFDYPNARQRKTMYAPPRIAEMMVPDADNWSTPAWPPGWNATATRPGPQLIGGWLAVLAERERTKK